MRGKGKKYKIIIYAFALAVSDGRSPQGSISKMTASLPSPSVPEENGLPQNSQKAMTKADIPIAPTLADRLARAPDLAAENQALHTLARQPIDDPQSTLNTLVRIARDLCQADSVGIGLTETLPDDTSVWRWVAIAGALEFLEQPIAPSNFSLCDTAIHCGEPQLYARPELYFTYLHHPQFPIVEGMQFPLCANDRPLGTLWMLSHSEQRQFDREDLRLMTSLASFAATALQNIHLRQTAEGALQREQAAKLETAATRQALDESANRAVEILESITDAVVYLDREWRITYVNRGVARINNLSPEEIIGKTHWEMWPWSVGTIVEQTYRQVVADRVAAHFEFFYEPLKMWLEIHAYPAPAGLSIYFRDISDRKLAENALRESEEFSRSVFESSADCLKVLDINGCLLSMNGPGLCLMEIEDCTLLVGTSWIEFWPDSDRANADRAVKTAAAGGTGRFSGYCPTAKKTPKWWEVVVTPILDVAGKPKQLLVTSRDVTDRQLADDALGEMSGELERQLRKFDAIASNVPDFIYTFDLSGRFTYINQPLLNLWQKTAAEAVGKNFIELDYPTDLATRLQDQIQQVIETRQPLRDETLYTSAVGTRAYEYIFVPLDGANGAVEAVAGVTRDITDRQQAEAALRHSEEKFRNMADNAPFMVWVTDPTGYCHYLSQSWYDFTGHTPETGLGFGWLNATHPDDREYASQAFLAANERLEAFRLEYRLRRSDGEYIWAIDAASPWFGVEGEFKGYIGSVIDIDDRKQAESALRRSEERYRTLFESIDEGFCVIEVLFDENDRPIDYRFLETNPMFQQQSGLVQVEGKKIRELVPNHKN